MAPGLKDNTTAAGDDKLSFLKLAFKCTNGTIDFDTFATHIGSPNGEAARKKFKRVFEKDEVPLNIVGSTLSSGTDGVTTAKAARTPKSKATNGEDASESTATPKTRASARKRKVTDFKEESSDENDDEETAATPKKKARTTNGTKTPKSPKAPKTPRAPRTPKGVAASGSKVEDSEDTTTDVKEDDEDEARVGSPEIQAKTDAIVKGNEKATGAEIGDAAKQAIHDGVAKEMSANEDEE